jgi:hypothetical protein
VTLNSTSAEATYSGTWGDTAPNATNFYVQGNETNATGGTYVAYLFAHDAGGFGLTGTDNVISCGSFTTDGSGNATVSLGYEPQWVLAKNIAGGWDWVLYDNMRGIPTGGVDALLRPNLSNAESSSSNSINLTATGFTFVGGGSATHIYIAIRRGPMKVPTDATKVFKPVALNAPANGTQVTTGFPVDLSMFKARDGGPSGQFQDRLRGLPSTAGTGTPALYPDATAAESTNQTGYEFWNTGYRTYTSQNAVWWMFRRAPGFFDVVCWTGDGANPRSISHNLTVAPTLIITKKRNSTSNWITGYDFAATTYKYFFLNDTSAANSDTYASTPVYGGNPTASVFIVGNQGNINQSGDTYVSYLFATAAGVSKVGSYTGTGTTLQINCGFTAGSRFVMIKRTDSTGDWYVWDSARGIVAGNDPHLSLNTTAAEVTTDDSVDTDSAGFVVNQNAATNINVTSASYIFLAVS